MPLALADYLGMTPAGAETQWQFIRRRAQPTPGSRQEAFRPVETLLAYAIFFIVNPHRYGGRNEGATPQPFQQVCAALKRTRHSVLEKMLNLDGTRAHGAKHEWELFVALDADPQQFSYLYRLCLGAARNAGLREADLPDFLGIEQGGELRLIGQDEIPPRVLEPVLEPVVPAESARLGAGEEETERLLEAMKSRRFPGHQNTGNASCSS